MKRLLLACCLLTSPAFAQQPSSPPVDSVSGYRELLMEANDRAVNFNSQMKVCNTKEEALRKENAELKAKIAEATKAPEEKK